jgi:acyl dehydratase
MTTELTIEELERAGELDLGAGPWTEIAQRDIDLFAEATRDHQWIHVDHDAAARGPFGTTVAHGYLTLALLPGLMHDLLHVTDATIGINYGIDRLRFTAAVPSGSRVRLAARIRSSERRESGLLYRLEVEVAVEGNDRPALVGEVLFLVA